MYNIESYGGRQKNMVSSLYRVYDIDEGEAATVEYLLVPPELLEDLKQALLGLELGMVEEKVTYVSNRADVRAVLSGYTYSPSGQREDDPDPDEVVNVKLTEKGRAALDFKGLELRVLAALTAAADVHGHALFVADFIDELKKQEVLHPDSTVTGRVPIYGPLCRDSHEHEEVLFGRVLAALGEDAANMDEDNAIEEIRKLRKCILDLEEDIADGERERDALRERLGGYQ